MTATNTPTDSPTATPTAPVTISGTVTYGNAIGSPATRAVPNVVLSGSGAPPVVALTDLSGAYSLSGFGSGAYDVTATKVGDDRGFINAFDAALIAQHVVGPPLPVLTGNQLVVADVSGNGGITSFDAGEIANYVVQLEPIGATATWRFLPQNRNYPSVTTSITGEDYSALLMGEVSGDWIIQNNRLSSGPQESASVKLPQMAATTGDEVIVPVRVRGAANKGVIAYEFNLRYDPSVVQPQEHPVDLVGTASERLAVAFNANEPGLLRVAVYGATPIDGSSILANLRFTAVGATGSVSPITWERFMLNGGAYTTLVTDGQIAIVSANQGEVDGRVADTMGRGVANAVVTLTDTTGQTRVALSDASGSYRFDGLQTGQTYTISVDSNRHHFAPMTVSVAGRTTSLNMVADQ